MCHFLFLTASLVALWATAFGAPAVMDSGSRYLLWMETQVGQQNALDHSESSRREETARNG
jgi:hypothetical protein